MPHQFKILQVETGIDFIRIKYMKPWADILCIHDTNKTKKISAYRYIVVTIVLLHESAAVYSSIQAPGVFL